MKMSKTLASISLGATMAACTGQLPGSLLFKQVEEAFEVTGDVNTKVDILWVVDDSSSMDVSQKRLREGFSTFATKYMKPTWDIKLAVIPTDAYMSRAEFSSYLTSVIPGSTGISVSSVSAHMAGIGSSFVNPSNYPTLVNTTSGTFPGGIPYGALNPQWGSSYSTLAAGIHDGPIKSLCVELMPYFFGGVTDCGVRDLRAVGSSSAATCINPLAGQDDLSECVNTTQNNTVHSGKTVISTRPPAGTPGDATWVNGLIRDFRINASKGSSGHGSERGIDSVLRFIATNEQDPSLKFFRSDSAKLIVFLSDEDDQSMDMSSAGSVGFNPFSDYRCDQAGLITMNGGTAGITSGAKFCCATSDCRHGKAASALTCASSSVEGQSYTVGICPDPTKLLSVTSARDTMKTYFEGLNSSGDANLSISVITPTTWSGIQSLQSAREATDAALNQIKVWAVNKGSRYIELAGYFDSSPAVLDIASANYTPVLDAIGQKIIEKLSTYQLLRTPSSKNELIVQIIRADGSRETVQYDDFEIQGSKLVLTNETLVLGLGVGEQIYINYQPQGES